MTSIPLNCPTCNGTGGGLITWTSDGTSLTPPPWVEEAQRAARCATCGGTGHVYYLFTQTVLPLQSDVIAQLLDVREISGCDSCRAAQGAGDSWLCGLETEPQWRAADIPTTAPDWCPLRKGSVTLKLKEGA